MLKVRMDYPDAAQELDMVRQVSRTRDDASCVVIAPPLEDGGKFRICSVSFFGYLRPELKFDGLEPLVAQIRKDEEEARALLAGVQPLSDTDRCIAFS